MYYVTVELSVKHIMACCLYIFLYLYYIIIFYIYYCIFIGKRFAEIEIKLALVKLLSKFEVEPCEKTEIPVTFSNLSIIAIPNNGTVWLKLNLLPGENIQ